ncbi:MAG: hypothetical protein JWP91_1063 [Fibrobacteres bacterium]|nr:hypothetical protein [Fibrobacterota bacterium]
MFKFANLPWKSLLLAGTGLFLFACGGGGGKKVYFGNLEDGSNVESPFKVDMKVENLIVEPATMGVNEGHGHFHIIVDASLASPSEPMSKDAKHIHYGDGQTSTTLDLPVGQHTLILQFAKGDHVPYDPPIYQQIQVNVTKQNAVDTTAQAAPVADSAAAMAKAGADTSAAKVVDSTSAKGDSAAAKAPKKPAKKAK